MNIELPIEVGVDLRILQVLLKKLQSSVWATLFDKEASSSECEPILCQDEMSMLYQYCIRFHKKALYHVKKKLKFEKGHHQLDSAY